MQRSDLDLVRTQTGFSPASAYVRAQALKPICHRAWRMTKVHALPPAARNGGKPTG